MPCLLTPLKLSCTGISEVHHHLRVYNSRYSFHVDEVGERELGGAAAGRSAPGGGGGAGSGGAARRNGPHANVAVAVGEAVGEACITHSGIEGSVAPIEGC